MLRINADYPWQSVASVKIRGCYCPNIVCSDLVRSTEAEFAVSYLRRAHLIAGLAALVIFPLTGAYMRFYLADEFAASDRLRFSFRANHIYILLSSLIHISLGAYLR